MNERIKELLLKAGWDMYEALDERNQKFAELIVRECANVAAEHDVLDIYEEIREHFDISELKNDN